MCTKDIPCAVMTSGPGSGIWRRSKSSVLQSHIWQNRGLCTGATVHCKFVLMLCQVALAVAAAAPVDSLCLPCMMPVAVHCFGQHLSQQHPCSSAAPFCCGVPCGRPLPCGTHACSHPCHPLGVSTHPPPRKKMVYLERPYDSLVPG